MALLNFANTYAEVADRLQLPVATSGPYIELVFTKDGHIINRGTDFTPTFTTGARGLVPGSSGKKTEFIRGNGLWLEITTTDLPMATSVANAIASNTTNTTLLTTQLIIDHVNNSFIANDAMRYKGTISFNNGVYTTITTAGTVDTFPTKCDVGDTYRIISAGTYAGLKCSSGDLLVCILKGTGNALNTAAYWTAVEANINGEIKHSVNGTSIYTYSSSANVFNIFAPTTGGVLNQILLSNGATAPVWANQSAIIAGDIIDSAKKALLTAVTLGNTGIVSVSVGGTTKASTAATGTWAISITGLANRVGGILSTGAGLILGTGETYNGSVSRILNMLPATATTIGGILLGYVENSKNYAVLISSEKAYVTVPWVNTTYGLATASADGLVPKFDAVGVGALATNSWVLSKLANGVYDWFALPATAFSDTWRDITIGGVSIGKRTLNFIPSGDVYLKTDSVADNIEDISFGISWFNLTTNKYETA